jgi:hypothetical protein
MNRYRVLLFIVALSTLISATPLTDYCIGRMRNKLQDRPMSLTEILVGLGVKHGRFFTLEEAWKDGESDNWMEVYNVQWHEQNKDIVQDLEKLRQVVPNFAYRMDRTKPQIIHISDSRLTKLKGYGVEDSIKRINFTGIGFDLVNEIGQQGIPISSRGPLSPEEMLGIDHSTRFHADGKGLKVRDALSNYIPVKGRAPIIWIARTRLERGEKTYIRYIGGHVFGS